MTGCGGWHLPLPVILSRASIAVAYPDIFSKSRYGWPLLADSCPSRTDASVWKQTFFTWWKVEIWGEGAWKSG